MKNPLNRRFKRELRKDLGKYLAVFLFLFLMIGFVSGALVAGSSMIHNYDESFEKYQIEDGRFELPQKADKKLISKLEKEKLTVYENFYKEKPSVKGSTLRIFTDRKQVDKVCLIKGKMPKKADEIAIDRMYADNNNVSCKDTIKVGGKQLKVTGLVALSDYSALFSDNSDSMFDATKFGTAIMTKEGFKQYKGKIHYNYAWKYDKKPSGDIAKKKRSDKVLKVLSKNAIIEDYVPEYANQAIHFTGDDLGGDRSLYIVLLYILIVIIAFMFAVTTNNTISKEASVIGTLRASGYTKQEIVKHYLFLPTMITVVAAALGNITGYTYFKNFIANLYYSSYSLPTYKTIWNGNAFILTTIVPMLIVFIINFITISKKISLSPIRFLRNDLSKHRNKKAVKLPQFKFFTRFRLRVILQNMPGYFTMFIGVCFANVLLLFGMMMTPLLTHYQDQILNNQIAKYQYILKAPIETKNKKAEKYAVTSLQTSFEKYDPEEVSIYGISTDSDYMKDFPKKNTIEISDSLADKYGIKKGDTITLKERYKNKKYHLKVNKIRNYPASLCVFMNRSKFNKMFKNEKGYYNGWFSNKKLKDLNDDYVQTVITKDSLTKLTRQMENSMGNLFYIFHVVSAALYMILFFVLAKVVMEKNQISISMVKILGYQNSEIRRLYLRATGIAVTICMLITIPASYYIMKAIYVPMMREAFSGWLTFYVKPTIYPQMFVMGMVCYFVIEAILYRKMKKIPMTDCLKQF